MLALFVVKHAKKWYLRRIKVKKMLLKRGILQKNTDIYSLFWQKIINFACVLL